MEHLAGVVGQPSGFHGAAQDHGSDFAFHGDFDAAHDLYAFASFWGGTWRRLWVFSIHGIGLAPGVNMALTPPLRPQCRIKSREFF